MIEEHKQFKPQSMQRSSFPGSKKTRQANRTKKCSVTSVVILKEYL